MLKIVAKLCPGYLIFILLIEINRKANNFSEANTNYRPNASRQHVFSLRYLWVVLHRPMGFHH